MERYAIILACLSLSLSAAAEESLADSLRGEDLNELVVTGSNHVTERNLLPYSVSTVSAGQLRSTGRSQLLSALQGMIPGFFVTERSVLGFGVSNGGSGGIKLRGVGGSPTSQILMMVDGKPQFSGVYSHPIADNYNLNAVERVEVLKGPASVLYGSNAMGGAINIITRTPKQDGINTTLQAQYGSHNTLQTSATNSIRSGRFFSLMTLGYDRTDGTVQDFDYWQTNAYAKIGYDITDNWTIWGDGSVMKFKGNDPIYARVEKGQEFITRQDIMRGEASVVLGNTYQSTDGAMRLYYSNGNHNIWDPTEFQSYDSRIGILTYQNWNPWQDTHLTAGFDFDHYMGEIARSGGKDYAPDVMGTTGHHSITEYSPYISASQGVLGNVLVLNAGLRIALSSTFQTQYIPQGGIVVRPGRDWTLKASVAKGYRNPSFKELYVYYPRSINNPDLKPESMVNYELSIGKTFAPWLSVEVTGFVSQGDNLIQILDKKNVNTGEFLNRGFEFAAISSPHRNLNLRATYSYLCSDLTKLTGAPKHQFSLMADWDFCKRFTANAMVRGIQGLYVADDVDIQNYTTLDLRINYHAHRMIDLFIQGNNLTDTSYCINRGYTMPGITFMGGFKLNINN